MCEKFTVLYSEFTPTGWEEKDMSLVDYLKIIDSSDFGNINPNSVKIVKTQQWEKVKCLTKI